MMANWLVLLLVFLVAGLFGWWLRGRVELKGSIKSEVELWRRVCDAARKINKTHGGGLPW